MLPNAQNPHHLNRREVLQNAPGDAKFQKVLEAHEASCVSPLECVDNEDEFNSITRTRVFMSRDLQESKDIKIIHSS